MPLEELDPLIHVPARLRIMATHATLLEGDTLSFTRLQELTDLTPGNLITHIRKLEDAGYIEIDKSGSGASSLTTVALTSRGRQALGDYSTSLRKLLDGV